MTSRAQIAKLTKADPALRIPYRDQERSLGELQALGITLTAEDYKLVRHALGGGKRGRARARDLVPLQCPSCGCRLTLFDRSGREPYFAPTDDDESASHGLQCESDIEVRETISERIATAETAAPLAPEDASVGALAAAVAPQDEVATPSLEPATPGAHYVIDDASVQRDARQLLTQALHRAVPPRSVVQFRAQTYAVTAAADVHELSDGQLVAIYGRFTELEWNEDFGRLILRATPRTVQVWATASAPRRLLQLEAGQQVEAPTLQKPAPFLVFGTLRKLNAVCGVPVVRSDMLVLLQPLSVSFRAKHALRDKIHTIDGMALLPTAIERAERFSLDPSSDSAGESDVANAADITAASASEVVEDGAPASEVTSADDRAHTPELTVVDGAVVAADSTADDVATDAEDAATEDFADAADTSDDSQGASARVATPAHSEIVELPRAAAQSEPSSGTRSKGKRRKRQRTTSRSIAAGVGRSRSDS